MDRRICFGGHHRELAASRSDVHWAKQTLCIPLRKTHCSVVSFNSASAPIYNKQVLFPHGIGYHHRSGPPFQRSENIIQWDDMEKFIPL